MRRPSRGWRSCFGPTGSRFQEEFYETQYRILQSRRLTRKTIGLLGLEGDPRFGAQAQEPSSCTEAPWARVTGRVTAWISGVVGRPSESPDPLMLPDDATAEGRFVNCFRAGLTITPVSDSQLVDVTYRSTDPKFAARIANGYAKAYIEDLVEQKFLVSSEAADWLGGQLAEHRLQVEASEAALQNYREQNDGVVVEDGQNVVVQRLVDLNAAVTRARTTRLEREALFTQLDSLDGSTLESFPLVVSNTYVQQLRSELSIVEREQEELAQTYGERHPEIIRIGAAVTSARTKLNNEIDKVVWSVRSEFETAVANEQSLTQALKAQQREALAVDRRSMEYTVLVREAESHREVYQELLARARETTISRDLRRTNVRIVDRAEIPSYPSAPRTLRDLALAALGALLLGVGLVFSVEYLDNRIKNPDELAALVGLPVVGMVPKVRKFGDKAILDGQLPPNLAEALRSIRTNVLFSTAAGGARSVLITSPGPGEGKSLIAGGLAWSLGQAEQRVLLVDCDMRRPRVHEVMGCSQEPGLSDLLVGQCRIDEAVRKTSVPGLDVIPAGQIPPNPAELLGSVRFRDYIDSLGRSYDWIVMDSPPVLAVTDPSVLVGAVSGILIVIGADQTAKQSACAAVDRLRSFRARLIGTVLNRVDVDGSRYYYAGYYRKDYARYYTKSTGTSSASSSRPQKDSSPVTLGLR